MQFQPYTIPRSEPQPLLGSRALGVDGARHDALSLILEGLDPGVVERLARHLDAPVGEVLKLISLPRSRYMARRTRGERLSPSESEAAYDLARVIEAAEACFDGDTTTAHAWLARSLRGLGGRTPLELARTSVGATYVTDLLGRIEHGIIG